MTVRSIQPGEVDPWAQLRAPQFNGARLHTGHIVGTPDVVNGIMSVLKEGTNVPFDIAIPAEVGLQLSGASWRRWIPQEGTKVLFGYDTGDRPRVLSYCMYEALSSRQQDAAVLEGHKIMLERYRGGVSNCVLFSPLQAGEFDQKSAGGAYTKWSNTGALLLSGRSEVLNLDGENKETSFDSGRYHFKNVGGHIKFGDTRRKKLSTNVKDLLFDSPLSTGSGAAFEAVSLGYAELKLGDLRDTAFIDPITLTSTMPKLSGAFVPSPVMFSLKGYSGPHTIPGPSVGPLPAPAPTPEALQVAAELVGPSAVIEGDAAGGLVLQARLMAHVKAPIVTLGPTVEPLPTNPIAKAVPLTQILSAMMLCFGAIKAAIPALADQTPVTGPAAAAAAAVTIAAAITACEAAVTPAAILGVASLNTFSD